MPARSGTIRTVLTSALMASLLAGAPAWADDPSTGAAPANTRAPEGPRVEVAQAVAAPDDTNDPLEPVNRAIFWINEALDLVIIRPAAEIYRAVLPDPVETGVRNVLQNLRTPLNMTNQLLQGDWKGAGDAAKRFAINTTMGIGGVMDVAADMGFPYEYESFDQTLAIWGVPEGPYLVLPLIGASSFRDGPALLAEVWADPVARVADATDREWFNTARTGVLVVDTRAQYITVIDDLRANSVDYYAAMRSLYRQRRDGWVRDGAPAEDQFPDIPDYD